MLDWMDYFFWIIPIVIIVFRKGILSVTHSCLSWSLYTVTYGIVLPGWGADRELTRNLAANGPAMDSFELLYVFNFFSVYWIVMAITIVIVLIIRPDGQSKK